MSVYGLAHYAILASLAPGASSYLEVGVQEGGSLMAVIKAAPGLSRVVLCDTWDNRHGGTGRGSGEHIRDLVSSADLDLEILDGRSQETIASVEGIFDLTHVDGSHDFEDAAADLRNVWMLTGGAMVVHDISFPQVWRAVCAVEIDAARAEVSFEDQGSIVFYREAA